MEITEARSWEVTPKKVSIIVPTYNMEGTIGQTINSILKQNYPNKEIIVIDDGSTDNTGDKFRYCSGLTYIKQNNLNTAEALNHGIKRSTGEYITWLSADDYYIDDEATSKRVRILEENRLDFVHSFFNDKDGNNIIRHDEIPSFTDMNEAYQYNKKTCWINGSTLLFRKDVCRNIGLFNGCYRYVQDWDFWFRLLKYHKGTLLREILVERGSTKGVLAEEILEPSSFGRQVYNKEMEMVFKYLRMLDNERPTICAMICMKNEENMIETCLDDLTQWVDKIVIFNDGSTDSSLKRICQYPKVVDIHNQLPKGNKRTEGQDRKRLFQMAQEQKTDWILFIDSDEVFEHKIKWDIFDLIHNKEINLYSFLEVDFYRCFNKYRVDENWYKGWFARLFQNLPKLEMNSQPEEDSGGVPHNIPGVTFWQESEKNKFSNVRVKHYGFAYWNRVVDRYMRRMERVPAIPDRGVGGAFWYERMIDETGLELREYEGDRVADYIKRELC